MKKLLALFILSAVSSVTFAEVVIFNQSYDGYMNVTYRLCQSILDSHNVTLKVCGEPKDITIKKRNYVTLETFKDVTSVSIDKAQIMDDSVNPPAVVAQGIYSSASIQSCTADITDLNTAFLLNNNNTWVITCLHSAY